MNTISQLKINLRNQKIDFFFLPNSNEFFVEYLPENEKRIQYLTGFTGSNASIIFTHKKSKFFTDGRYLLQAKNELDLDEFEILDLATNPLFTWLEDNIKPGETLALGTKLSNINFVKSCEKIVTKKSARLVLLDQNPIDKVVDNFFQNPQVTNKSPIYFCEDKLSGGDIKTKCSKILEDFEADALIVAKPENICWLLNMRASDVAFTPLLLTYAIIYKKGNIELFVDEKRFTNIPKAFEERVTIVQHDCFDLRLSALKKSIKKIQIDPNTTNYWVYNLLLKNEFEIIFKNDNIELTKSCKNENEINSITKAHEVDGLAVTKFLFWLKESSEIDEIQAAEKLLWFRKKNKNFLYPSFATISGFASNGAIIHYHPSLKTNKKLISSSLYLVDSGGQYFGKDFCGTTDITRTIAIGKPSAEMIKNFTRVLKGHIFLARAKFPVGTTGVQLDSLARFHLWQEGLDYEHGTGHGVGNFLSVHEGPCGISKRSHQPLLPGMILSNEPGFYKEGEYGIRIENLMLVEKFDENFLQFRNLTLAPIDVDLTDFSMLTYPEKKWLLKYHEQIFTTLSPSLKTEEKTMLNGIVNQYEFHFRNPKKS